MVTDMTIIERARMELERNLAENRRGLAFFRDQRSFSSSSHWIRYYEARVAELRRILAPMRKP
jgi:hypothetical protein